LPFFLSGCANSSRGPSGGPKDTIPPDLLGINPAYYTTNFKGKQVSFTFNEYVQFKDQNKQFIISPPLEKRPVLKIRGKQAIVEFASDLHDNTTYFIDFGTSVVDLNESNPAKYLSTVFSTGSVIDSMIYVGRLVDAFTLDPVEGSFVFLYEEDIDSIPYLKNPNALTRSDKDGVFVIKGLKPIDYKIVAVDDLNGNYKYDGGGERIAFSNTLVQTMRINDSDTLTYGELPMLKMFSENLRRQFLSSYKQPEKRQIELIFNQINPEIISFDVENLTTNDFIIEHSRWNDTLRYWIKNQTVPDSIKAVISYMKTDSLNQLSPTELNLKMELEEKEDAKTTQSNRNRKKKEQEEDIEEIITPNIISNARTILEKNIRLSFKSPLITCDTTLLALYKFNDEGDKKEKINFKWMQDTLHIREYSIQAEWKTSGKYELNVQPYAFTDIYGLSNDSIVITFETANPDKYSSITVNLNNADGTYIVQLIKDKNVLSQKIASGEGKLVFRYLDAAKYRIRIIEDKNNNGIWDAGLYLQKLQPERVGFVKFSDNSDELDLRASWDIEQMVDINLIFK
jgi:hypothetical protein